MKTLRIPNAAIAVCRCVWRNRKRWIQAAGGLYAAVLILMSCVSGGRTNMVPASIPGADFVGTSECASCHEELVRDFRTADHAMLQAKGGNSIDMGCESCHGPGSKHVGSGGAPGTIIDPDKSPESCYRCHLDTKAQFNLPYSHQVLSGKMTCSECHDPHKGSANKGGGTSLARTNDTCTECHTQQRGPFVFQHEATREGCTACHAPHGSTNQKMLTERNSTLCLKCHFQDQTGPPVSAANQLRIGSSAHDINRMSRGTCWTAGCHEGVHGSNTDRHLRY
jgi:predicted CXXCH cytochrome family protein